MPDYSKSSDDELHLLRKGVNDGPSRELIKRINQPALSAQELERQRKTADNLRMMPKAAVDSRGLGIPVEGSRNTLKPSDY